MVTRIIVSVAAVLALSAGVAYAASELTSSDGTHVCVNDANGLMRVSATCRAGEHPLTIGGGGGNVLVTQNGTFTVPAGQAVGKALPLSGITVSGKCELAPAPAEVIVLRVELQAAAGKTLDAFATAWQGGDVIGGTSVTVALGGVSPDPTTEHTSSWTTIISTSGNVTATVTVGGAADWGDQECTYLWQAVEAPN